MKLRKDLNSFSSLFLLLISIVFITGCINRYEWKELIDEPLLITIDGKHITPEKPFRAIKPMNELCIQIPEGYKPDTKQWSFSGEKGELIYPYAVLISKNGNEYELRSRAFLSNRKKGQFVCLFTIKVKLQSVIFNSVTLFSNIPFKTQKVVWRSYDK